MRIQIEIPKAIVEHLKAKGYNDVKIRIIFMEYVDFEINRTSHQPLDGFTDWMDNNFEE